MEGDHRPDLPSCEDHGPKNCDPYCSKCYRLLRDERDRYRKALFFIIYSADDAVEMYDAAGSALSEVMFGPQYRKADSTESPE